MRSRYRLVGRARRTYHAAMMTTPKSQTEGAVALRYGPTYDEMLHPERIDPATRERALALERDSLDPLNLFNLTWKDAEGRARYFIVPPAVTGVDAPILVLLGKHFPTGSHKVGPAYCCAIEPQLRGDIEPGAHTLVWPSTGNYGIGGAWVGPRLGYRSLVVLPEEMSRERYEMISGFGAEYIKTPGSESNVKEIYDKVRELSQVPQNRVLNQFAELPNYRFHYHVTGNSAAEACADAKERLGVGSGRAAAFVSAMGSAGTIAAGDRLKDLFDARIVGLEPTACPTLYENGYGAHDIQGIGDKHVTWIHRVHNMDLLCCIDDIECKEALQALCEEPGKEALRALGVSEPDIEMLATSFGISGLCNLIGAIKTARFYGLGPRDVVVTVATDSIERYHSTMGELTAARGHMTREIAEARLERILRGQKLDWMQEGTEHVRRRWHNLKYFTWVEQQGRSVEELDAQLDSEWWQREQARIPEVDQQIRAARGDG